MGIHSTVEGGSVLGSSNTRRLVSLGGGDAGGETLEKEARAAVAELLREEGLSEEESIDIGSNSPNYVKMLIEGVRELDEASLWDSWKVVDGGGVGTGSGGSQLSFKEKVLHVARVKKDRGILPFLESTGLNPSTSTHVARYLSSETLLNLIHKVKYVKEMFFSGSDQGAIIGKNAHRMMTNLSIFVDDDIQQTLSFFAKMEARRGGLNMLDSKDASFPYLIESFPRLLLLSIESHLRPLVEYFEAVGVPKRQIRNIILIYPPIVFSNIKKEIEPRVQNLKKVGIEDKAIGKMLVKYPWILSTSIQDNYEEIISFFNVQKVPKEHVDRAIRSWPLLLGSSTTKMKSMVVHFGELGVRNKKLGQVIVSSPQLLLQKPHEFHKVVLFMEELGFEEESIGKILGRCPEIFAASVEKTFKKKLQQLVEFGISEDRLSRVISKFPELLISDVNHTLLPRMRYLMKVGLSKREVLQLFLGEKDQAQVLGA
ncbi:hypothetical protein MRB53_008748 [Persea americana]|uniref:Uncharacterized protein n=1 Tax=Persea americana TaxID=3435 RepID=A0ACC2LLY9_PERAE|nr:hypothetical protein MRB53_008748 [Persea americana]